MFQLGEEFTSDILDDVQALINPISKGGNSLTWLQAHYHSAKIQTTK